jgi:hypothetical protein
MLDKKVKCRRAGGGGQQALLAKARGINLQKAAIDSSNFAVGEKKASLGLIIRNEQESRAVM